MRFAAIFAAVFLISGCGRQEDEVNLSYEAYALPNGLKVVLHEDHSAPVVAQAIQFHVGSAREKEGKTGFAHFFEHMLFQRSENLPRNAFFQKISELGGDFNGGTSFDGTVYYEVVPRDALEKILWMESDRMGYFINTVTQAGLEREIDVILNEKRQGVDNAPYGQLISILTEELFPKGHPYSWAVIGKMADISSATIEDVKEFYANYYVPSNATLVLSGDFDIDNAKELISKYFAEIPSHPVEKPKVWNITLDSVKRVEYEDPFANMPYMLLAYPTVEEYNDDEFALQIFADLFGGSKKSPLYKSVVEANLAPEVNSYNESLESAGLFAIDINAYENVNLDTLYSAVNRAFALFEQQGIDPDELQMLKNRKEYSTYSSLQNNMYKAMMMASSNEFGGSPDRFIRDLSKFNNVTAEDVMRVYEKYIKGKNYLGISLVPKGQVSLALNGSSPATVDIESPATQKMTSKAGAIADEDYTRTPSNIDRSVEPGLLENTPEIIMPNVWSKELANGLKIQGVTKDQLPLVQFSLTIKGGQLLDPDGKEGVANLTAQMMKEGTALHSAEDFQQAVYSLGGNVIVLMDGKSLVIMGSCLSKNIGKLLALVDEMLTQPKFEQDALDRVKMQTLAEIRQNEQNPSAIARKKAKELFFGSESVLAKPVYGTAQSISGITLDDIKECFAKLSPDVSALSVAGKIDMDQCVRDLEGLVSDWSKSEVKIPEAKSGKMAESGLYFVDYPEARQSVIYVIGAAPSYSDPDYELADVFNYKLGSGSNGMLFNVLRLERGYTYGAYSGINNELGLFTASSSVQSSVTKESVALFKEIFSNYSDNFSQEMLDQTRTAMIRNDAFAFETIADLVTILNNCFLNDLPYDYLKKQEDVINNATVDRIKEVAGKCLADDQLIYVVVGDAKTQLPNLKGAKLLK